MGYTHYVSRWRRLPRATFLIAADDCRKVVETLCRERNFKVHVDDETSEPAEFSSDAVGFNGIGEDGHETFLVERIATFQARKSEPTRRDGWHEFTKTNCKPYDVAVCACLIVFHHHFGQGFRVSSDGDDGDEGWVLARECCQRVLGYGGDFSLKVPPRMAVHGLVLDGGWYLAENHSARDLSNGWRITRPWSAEFRWMVTDPKAAAAGYITGGHTIQHTRWKATVAYFQAEFSDAPFLEEFVDAMTGTPGEWSAFLAWSDKLQDHGFDTIAKKLRGLIPRAVR